MTIHSRKYPYNMAPWLAEKSEHICEFTCLLVDRIKLLPLAEDQKKDLLNQLHPILYDATKIIEYAYDTEIPAWTPEEAERMLKLGPRGYKNFMAKVTEFSDMEIFKSFPLDNENEK